MEAAQAIARTSATPKSRTSRSATTSLMDFPERRSSLVSAASALVPVWRLFSTTRVSTLRPMGSIITVVAVLLTHLDRKPVAIMNPPIIAFGFVPTARMFCSTIRRCRPQRCIASASMNHP